ncbi:MAG: hypothetical protein WBO14_09130, partial [Gammaproteobacteria bacterium]
MRHNQTKVENEAARSYAIRRVNPFRGVMQVIEAEEGRALSCNGVVWEILVCARQSNARERPGRDNQRKIFYRFGMWSMDDGLLKRASSPAEDQDYFDLATKCEALVENVRAHHHRLPFRLEDNRELWLFDSDNQSPLVLLASLRPGASLPTPEPVGWSCCTGANGSPSQRRFPQTHDLETQVKQRAGFNMNKYCIKRSAGGDGVVETTGEAISANQFPVLLLQQDWANDEEQRRACDYIKWISPSLLTLQHLDRGTRTRIENNLNVQAISIEHH